MTNPTTPAELMQANAVILLDEVLPFYIMVGCPLCTDSDAEICNETVCDECKHDATWS